MASDGSATALGSFAVPHHLDQPRRRCHLVQPGDRRRDLEWLTSGRDSLASGPGLAQHDYELATAQARTNAGKAPQLVTDVNARGGRTLRYAASLVGDYVEVPFDVASTGSYEVAVRHHRLADRGQVRAGIDGVDLAHGLVDPTMTVGEGYQVYPLGTVTLTAGTHRIDQRVRGGRWVSLGSYSFAVGDAGTIELSDDADGYVIADAVRLTLHGTT